MFVFRRPVRFADVDAARLVFFARFLDYCHEGLEGLFAELPGGYPDFVQKRDLGIPTVRIEADFRSPLRYGDVAKLEIEVLRLGRTSVTFRHVIRRESDEETVAAFTHVIVLSRLTTLTPEPLPADLRALLEQHRSRGSAGVEREGFSRAERTRQPD